VRQVGVIVAINTSFSRFFLLANPYNLNNKITF